MDFTNNVVIITGASLGLGEALALQLAEQGAWLSLAARNAERLEAVAEACRARGGRALAVPTDVAEATSCQALIEQTVAEYGRIDTLIANAGVSMWARVAEVEDPTMLEQIMRVNFYGSMYCAYYALPHLKATHGRIVVVSSIQGRTGVPTRSMYSASKHAQVGFFESLRIELEGSGVSVTIAFPDWLGTGAQARSLGPDGQALGTDRLPSSKAMPVGEAARDIIAAAAARRREIIMSRRARLGKWLKLFAPAIPDKMAKQAIDNLENGRHQE
jgi:short-subunit dehydrogenase